MSSNETLISIQNAILHLVDRQNSVHLANGAFSIHLLSQNNTINALIANISDVQWPLTPETASVKLDPSHYFFTIPDITSPHNAKTAPTLNYGLTLPDPTSENQELDRVLETYTSFSTQKVNADKASNLEENEVDRKRAFGPLSVVNMGSMVQNLSKVIETGHALMVQTKENKEMEARAGAYWTILAPNVEEYSGLVAKGIAKGSGQVVKGILWCGDVTADRIKWGNELLKKKIVKGESDAEISPETLKRIKRVKAVSRMTEKVATGVLSGIIKVSGYFTSSVANSKVGKKLQSLLPGEILLASLDGFGKICDAVEVAGKNVMSTSSTATTDLVSHRYGEQAAEAANQSLTAAGHAVGTAWTVFKIRKAVDPKSTIKPLSVAKTTAEIAAEIKANQGK